MIVLFGYITQFHSQWLVFFSLHMTSLRRVSITVGPGVFSFCSKGAFACTDQGKKTICSQQSNSSDFCTYTYASHMCTSDVCTYHSESTPFLGEQLSFRLYWTSHMRHLSFPFYIHTYHVVRVTNDWGHDLWLNRSKSFCLCWPRGERISLLLTWPEVYCAMLIGACHFTYMPIHT